MKLKSLRLNNFRSYKKQAFLFESNTVLIVGDNGTGKTNLLEAIYLLANGKSFRAGKSAEMIFYGQELGRVSGDVSGDEELTTLETMLTVGEVAGQKAPKKRYLVNGLGKRQMDFLEHLKCVLFRPEDIDLVLGSPSARREYLDVVLEQVDREYRRSNLSYQKGLRQRNKLLEKIREGEAERLQLAFWDKLLIKNGDIIHQKRKQFLQFVNQNLKKKKLELYLDYDASIISERRIKQYANQEVAAAKTLVGPHRDEIKFIRERKGKAKKNLSIFGSRGEQRMAILAVKLAELSFVKSIINKPPLLLLDDIFSELDHDNRAEIFTLLDKQQTIITTADKHLIPKKALPKKTTVIKL